MVKIPEDAIIDQPEKQSVDNEQSNDEGNSDTDVKDVTDGHDPQDGDENQSEADQDTDQDSDDAPEDISLKESKKLAVEKRKIELESSKTLKELKKQKVKEQEQRNILQQEEKRKRKPDSLVPEKLNDDIFQLVDNEIEVDTEDIFPTKSLEPKNNKIRFNDNDDSGKEDDMDGDTSEEEGDNSETEEKKKKISAKYIKDVQKDENNSAIDFLNNHFYGDRLERDGKRARYMPAFKMTKGSQKGSLKLDAPQWLKNRESGK